MVLTKNKELRAKNSMFTLIEMMIVIAIIGVLATILVVNIGNAGDGAKKADAKTEMSAIIASMIADAAAKQVDLKTVTYTDNTNDDIDMTDPWGTSYTGPTFNPNYERWEMSSAGPDKKAGNDDDVYSWK